MINRYKKIEVPILTLRNLEYTISKKEMSSIKKSHAIGSHFYTYQIGYQVSFSIVLLVYLYRSNPNDDVRK